jgi:cation diffusion facilitator family transporter
MTSSKLPIYSALIANILISVTKFVAAAVTGSSAMISEGIHSLVDSGNEILLLVGISKSKKPADEQRPFGYARELYFWAFIVSVLIFAVGGGISFYEGVTHLQHPHVIRNPMWNYIVLGAAIIFDGISFIIALREFNRQRGETPFWKQVRKSKDPTTFIVLFEDAADVLGLIVAFLGVYLGHVFQNPFFDGIASIIIGAILTFIAWILARESRSLLLGEALQRSTLDKIVGQFLSAGIVEKVDRPLSIYLGPEDVVLIMGATFKTDLETGHLQEEIKRLKNEIQKAFPIIKRIFIEPRPGKN